jgi:Uma2 family endonuclease
MSRFLLPQQQRYTYGAYLTWGDEVRGELIDGVFYDMSPAPSTLHQSVSIELATQVNTFLRGKPCRAFAAPFDVRLPHGTERDEDVDTVVQPDLVVVCDPARLDERGCRGAPDWVVEILSPRTAAKDQVRKRALYEAHGVREYWLVHPVDRVVTVYRLGAGGLYAAASVHETTGTLDVTALPGLTIDWSLVFPEAQAGASG